MKLDRSSVTFIAFGVAIMLNSFTTMVLFQKLSGDSTTPSKEPITRLLTPPSAEIR
jgi:hypothetical protein